MIVSELIPMSKSIKCLITPEVLKWARESIKLSLDDAARKIKVQSAKLASWEIGQEMPSKIQLLKASKVYKRHFSIFYLAQPPKNFQPLKDYRTFPDFESDIESEYRLNANVIEAYQKRDFALELYDLLDIEIKSVDLKITRNENTSIVAKKIREFLNINEQEIFNIKDKYQALKFWKRKVEDQGILVFQTSANSHLSIDLKVMRGFCIAENPLPVIVINSKDNPLSRIFTILHELVHIALGESEIQNSDFSQIANPRLDPIEVFCNQVAAEILVPSNSLLEDENIKTNKGLEWDINILIQIANKFQVTNEVILRRLLTLNKTTEDFYRQFRALQIKKYSNQNLEIKKKPIFVDYHKKVINACGEHLIKLAFSALYDNKITFSDMSHILSDSTIKHLNTIESAIFSR